MKKGLKYENLKLTTNGFTLIELIAVLIILAVIGLITMPIVNNSIENSRERALEQTIKNLEHAALVYVTENAFGRDTNYKNLSFDELKKKGYIENKDIINPTTNEPLAGCLGYKWDTDNNQYKIEYNQYCTFDPCYDAEVLVYDINLENCVNFIKDDGYYWDDEEDYERYCTKGQFPSNGYDSLETQIEDGYWEIDVLEDQNVIKNVRYETKCLSCFETQSTFKYDIDLKKCKEFITSIGAHYGEEDLNLFCTGKPASDGFSLEYLIEEGFPVKALEDAKVIKNVRYDDSELTISRYRCYVDNPYGMPEITDVEIPSNIGGKDVIAIRDYAFSELELTSVNFDKAINLQKIGGEAFSFNNFTEVKLNGLTNLSSIGIGAFADNQISKITLNNLTNVEVLGAYLFAGNNLTTVDLTGLANLKSINGKIFVENPLETIKIPNSVTMIFEEEFVNYNSLKEIIIDNDRGVIEGEPWGAADDVKITYLRAKKYDSIEEVEELVLNDNGTCKTDGSTYEYMGGCYIKADRSTTLKNHIWYNGFLWRIMGINSDGSVRMITEEDVTSIPYDNDSSDFNGSYVDNWLNEYFYNKLNNENNLRDDIIVSGKFCQGASTTDYDSARTDCTGGTIIERKVGLISVDEFNLSFISPYSGYLGTGQTFWTMSPYNSEQIICMYATDGVFEASSSTYADSIRPVINVSADAIITGGSGTLSDYYVLAEEKETQTNGNLSDAKIGEYISLNNKTYRVVENGSITKLILDGYYQENGANFSMVYGDDNIFTPNDRIATEGDTNSGIGYKLNTDVLNWLTAGDNQEKLKSAILPSTWYQNNFEHGNSYEISLNETNPTRSIDNVQVGLIRIGEMLSGQSYSILTNNGKFTSGSTYAKSYWSMTANIDSSKVWKVDHQSYSIYTNVSTKETYLRPVINIDNSLVTITSGNGTPNSPYVIAVK